MLRRRAFVSLFLLVSLSIVTVFAGDVFGQSPATRSAQQKEVDRVQIPVAVPKPSPPENKNTSANSQPADLKEEVESLKAENAAVREQLRRMEDQQKIMLDLVDRLQRRLDGAATTDNSPASHPLGSPAAAAATAPVMNPPDTSAAPTAAPAQANDDRYRDGIVIWEAPEDAKIPFLLKFNVNTQVRYLNTQNSKETFTDHLGVVREVHSRNDITVNRAMFILGGYMFSKKLQYSMTVWTSAGAASIVVAGNIGWRFNKALTLTGGYTGVPGSRSLVGTFPFFQPIDRSMADNFFRPGFTQGVWANGEPVQGLNYLVFVGNGLNTLNITANKIDTSLLFSGSVWWEPLGAYSEPGKSRQMYDDYFASSKARIRIGTSFTRSREDRFSDTDQSSPDNTSIYNSDGVLAFATGAFAPGVTVQKATYKMWAIDGGLKKSGFSVNGQYFMRWLNDFEADGPLPLATTFDHGFELSTGKFVVPKKLLLYVRGSKAFGEFANPYEYGGGFKWYFLPTERVWMTGEVMRVNKAPYSGAFTPYTAGMAGWMPMFQTVLAF
ncbi:MAG TPA: hypothetical protein VJT71_06560 [Pyrinomonadaceae bacterium]|nr:hypothetical protein [Pyrinomonadaceae bacterium]